MEEMSRQAGSTGGVEGIAVKGRVVEVTTSLDAVSVAYMKKVLLGFGGELFDLREGADINPSLPSYVRKPWREWPLWKRAGIHARFLLGLLSTIKVRR